MKTYNLLYKQLIFMPLGLNKFYLHSTIHIINIGSVFKSDIDSQSSADLL
jgi:hypothetical protein